MADIVDDLTFTLHTGKNGDVSQPVEWYLFPYFLTGQLGLVASSKWLAAVDGDPTLATQPVGTGPFVVQSYLPGDRMNVTRNPDYWRTDDAGNQLPYLDEIEFRVIVDSQVRAQALESGDVDLIATSDPSVVTNFVDNDDFTMLQQNVRTETELHPHARQQGAARLQGSALRPDPGRRQAGPDRRRLRRVLRAGQRPVLARPGRLSRGHRRPGVRPRRGP